jgi:hypothetical protein
VAGPAGWTSAQKYSDSSHAFIRYLGNFYTTRDFTIAPGFGTGTEYEFLVAPRVTYTVQASQKMSQNLLDWKMDTLHLDTACARSSVFSFTNTSSYQFTNRYFNLNEFYRKWNLYSAFVAQPVAQGGWSADSAITWNFEFREFENQPSGDGRLFLRYGLSALNQTLTTSTGLAGCWDNVFRARLRPMSAFGRQPQYACNVPFQICLKYCNDAVSFQDNTRGEKLKIMPNPTYSGLLEVKGMGAGSTVTVYDHTGRAVVSKKVVGADLILDIGDQDAGIYLVSIQNENGETRTARIISCK